MTALAAGGLAMVLAGTPPARADEPGVGQTRVSGRVFVDASHLDAKGMGRRTPDSGNGVDLKRLYFNVEHRFSNRWSARINTDIQWRRHQDPGDLWFKYAYVQGRFGKAFTLRLGSAPMPWSALVNRWSGYRYVDPDLVSRARVGKSADWGVHSLGSVGADGQVQYALAIVTGAGYKEPRLGNGPDIAARVSWQPGGKTILALGAYQGTRAPGVDSRLTLHSARRLSVMAAYAGDRWRAGAQYFRTRNWGRVLEAGRDRGHGWSVWASVQLTSEVALFVRRDQFKASRLVDPHWRDRYTHAGVEWRARSWLRIAAVWKRERVTDGAATLHQSDEAGLWAQVDF